MKKLTFISAFALFFTCFINIKAQDVVYVAPGGTGSGASWSDPMGNIASAIETAGTTKAVWVKVGEYNVTEEIVVHGTKVYGGFAGTETAITDRELTITDEPWSFAYPSVVKGNGSIRVFRATHAASLIDGFTVENGGATSSYISGMGGGAMIAGNSTVQNCIVRNNKSNNNYGGGVSILNGTLSNCLVEDNTTDGTSGNRMGGGIFTNPGATATATIKDCVVRSNTAQAVNGNGGGIASFGGGVTNILNSKIYNNQAVNGTTLMNGGAIYFMSGNAESKIQNCLIYNNSGSTAIFTGNVANYYNNTIVNNEGYVYLSSPTATYNLSNNIVWANNNGAAGAAAGFGGAANSENVLLNNNYIDYHHPYPTAATGNNIVDKVNPPLFIQPTSFIGNATNATQETEIVNANFQLQQSSPCIDKGMTIAEVTTDIAGTARPLGTAYEIGAYEFNPSLSSNKQIQFNDYNILVTQNGFRIQGLDKIEKVSVYAIDGTLIYNRVIAENTLIPLMKGIYIVRIADKTSAKIFIK